MQRLVCGQSLHLQIPECADAPTAVVFQRTGFADIATTIAPADDNGIAAITPVSQPARGVWQLRVVSDCGCYHAQVAVAQCKPLSFQSAHTANGHEGLAIVCCESDD